ncbi:hypothetical protein GCM10010269_71090 [Streptomyces humidus]|uniref:Uncharacterized protein n=1 Tax=Streptomyces humidus TaxID=52259 RepID=A0A918L9E1_9ACTN|nr:hypothetical protein GCM10010269_71090 [Streptomyces humidus]
MPVGLGLCDALRPSSGGEDPPDEVQPAAESETARAAATAATAVAAVDGRRARPVRIPHLERLVSVMGAPVPCLDCALVRSRPAIRGRTRLSVMAVRGPPAWPSVVIRGRSRPSATPPGGPRGGPGGSGRDARVPGAQP